MKDNSTAILNTSVIFGVILGVVLVAYSYLLFALELNFEKYLGYVSYLFLIVLIVIGTINCRDNKLNGKISFGNALTIGVLISIIGSIFLAIYTYLQFTKFDPGLMDKLFEITEQQLIDKGMDDEQIEMAMSMNKKIMSPAFIAIMSIITTAIIGLILSLISSAILKRDVEKIIEE